LNSTKVSIESSSRIVFFLLVIPISLLLQQGQGGYQGGGNSWGEGMREIHSSAEWLILPKRSYCSRLREAGLLLFYYNFLVSFCLLYAIYKKRQRWNIFKLVRSVGQYSLLVLEPFPCIQDPPEHFHCQCWRNGYKCVVESIPKERIKSWQ
jgi:hypothetical protein